MKESEDRHIEELVDKMMKHSALEATSVDFTSLVMGKVEAIKTCAHTTYEPLISKGAWLIIFFVSLVFVVGVMWYGTTEASELSNTFDFSYVHAIEVSKLFKGIQLTNTTRVSILMFAVMLLIQIPLLKNYFDKRALG